MLPPALRRFVDMFNVVSGSQQITQACVSLREQWEMGNANGVFHISHGKISNPQAPFRPHSFRVEWKHRCRDEGLGADSP